MGAPREAHAGLPLLIYKLRTEGRAWLWERLRREWEMPTTGPGRAFFRAARALGWPVLTNAAGEDGAALFAFYDLDVAPITYDILWFLVGADIQRRRLGLASIHVVIVPGREGGLRRERPDYEMIVDRAYRQQRIGNLLAPACALLPSVSGVTIASSRKQAADLWGGAGHHVFPAGYEPAMPIHSGSLYCLDVAQREGAEVASLRATEPDLRSVDRWLASRGCQGRVVTITVRGYDYMPARNSQVEAWGAFARWLAGKGFDPVIIPDTDQVLDGTPPVFDGLTVANEVAMSVRLRMALYERAVLNLGVNSGPMGLCWLNARTRYLTFKILTSSVPQTTPESIASHGFTLNHSLPFATPFQKWVWEDDDLAVIEREFESMMEMMERIEGTAVRGSA